MSAGDACSDRDEGHEQFQVARYDDAQFRVKVAAGRQGALGDKLIRRPVEDVDD